MENKKLEQYKECLKETSFLKEGLDLCAFDDETMQDRDSFEEAIYDYIQESVQVVYYHNAIEFLKENDPSLSESIELAEELCTPLKNINSEFLASILLQKYCTDEISEFLDSCEDAGLFEEVETEEEAV